MNNEKFKILMFDMILHSKFIYNPKNCKCDNPNCPPNCAFTPKIDSPIQKKFNPKTLLVFKHLS